MAQSIRMHYRQRRMQRWLRREAQLLARDAERFECPDATRAASRLMQIVDGDAGFIFEARSA